MRSAPFTFVISLSVLEHLGRHLYRSFATVLGEAISNSWDADAKHVRIYIDSDKNGFWITDDGLGMTAADFQDKFLKIGYSKRKTGTSQSQRGRPFIGRKGIGKLALLSCAQRVSILSKKTGGEYVGGVIDNSSLDEAITEDLAPQNYPLARVDIAAFIRHTRNHKHGTIIRFENLKDGVKQSLEFLRKTIALNFRFSLLDKSFKVYVDDKIITHQELDSLAANTEFVWLIGAYQDPFVDSLIKRHEKQPKNHELKRITIAGITGFIASVEKPRDLKVMTTDERVGIDLFVNGRLREKDILKHIPTARIAESYLYGQIHFNGLDDATDRFTSSRDGVVADDPKYQKFLDAFRKTLLAVVSQWDDWRRKHRREGDPENESISKTERASLGLYNVIAQQYEPTRTSPLADQVEEWVADLSADAAFNFESYAECFISENLVRRYITEKHIALSAEAKKEAARWQGKEKENMNKGNVSIQIRRIRSSLSYLSMDGLANLVDKRDKQKEASLSRDASEFKPIRDAVAHTALLTQDAKARLQAVRNNIKSRVRELLSGVE